MKTVLLAGATGRVGQQIAKAILNREAELRMLVLPQAVDEPQIKTILEPLVQQGANIVEGDVMDPDSLKSAVKGIDVAVSALRGSRELFVEGQATLAEMAKNAGAQRIIPSTFSSELFDIDFNDDNVANNVIFRIRREAADSIAATGLPATLIMNGTLMGSMLDFPPLTPFDLEKDTFNYWGDGEQPADYTALTDLAKFTAEAALDPDPPRRLRIAGDVLTMKEMKKKYEQVTGRQLAEHRLGSIEDLREEIAQRKAGAESPMDYAFHQIRYSIASGAAKLGSIDNDMYPSIDPVTFEDFIK